MQRVTEEKCRALEQLDALGTRAAKADSVEAQRVADLEGQLKLSSDALKSIQTELVLTRNALSEARAAQSRDRDAASLQAAQAKGDLDRAHAEAARLKADLDKAHGELARLRTYMAAMSDESATETLQLDARIKELEALFDSEVRGTWNVMCGVKAVDFFFSVDILFPWIFFFCG